MPSTRGESVAPPERPRAEAPGGIAPPVIAEALALRAWVLRLLAGVPGDPPPASVRAWDALIRAERCALPVRARAAGAPLPAEVRALVERRATTELQRFLSVQAQTRLLGKLLRERGWPGVALKGSMHAAEGGEPLDTADVDVLVPREHAVEFAALLEARGGHQAVGGVDAQGAEGAGWQLAVRLAQGGVPVEVHYDVPHVSLEVWAGARATRVPGVSRLAPADHLWHVLVHSVVHHRDRAGSLRDLILLVSARAACDAVEVSEVQRRASEHRDARALRSLLEMAEALARGEPPVDGFRAAAALRCAQAAGIAPWGARQRAGTAASFALLAGDGAYRSLWIGNVDSALGDPDFRGTTRWDRLGAPVWLLRTAWRSTLLAAATLPAWRAARIVGRWARV